MSTTARDAARAFAAIRDSDLSGISTQIEKAEEEIALLRDLVDDLIGSLDAAEDELSDANDKIADLESRLESATA